MPSDGRGEEAAERKPDAAGRDDHAEPDVARPEDVLGEEDLGHVDRARSDEDDVPDDEHGAERRGHEDEPDPVATSRQCPRVSDSSRAELALGDGEHERRRDEERHGVDRSTAHRGPRPRPSGRRRPGRPSTRASRSSGAASSRSSAPRRARGSAGPRRRPAGRSRWRSRRPRRARRSPPGSTTNGRAANTPKRTRSETTMSQRRESRSTSGPSSRPMRTIGRKSAISSAATQTPEPVRSLMCSVQRDRGEVRAEPGAGSGEEQQPEGRRAADESETAGAHGTGDASTRCGFLLSALLAVSERDMTSFGHARIGVAGHARIRTVLARLVGEVRPQPALGLADLDALPARVVLDLVAADPPDREVPRLRVPEVEPADRRRRASSRTTP